ncbi:MAG: PepSY domain-containing protein [Pseudobutyrivibrio sp.]|nr:PepSY domain-containing protein [Pseudobutyrivibrio sp.]
MKKRIFATSLSLIMFITIILCIPVTTACAASGITLTQAKEIALKDAGLDEKDVTIAKAKKEIDDGITQYEIKFYYGTTEYDYEINATTGEIISFDQENESIHAADNPKESLDDVNTTGAPVVNGSITEDQALQIALADAGYTTKDVTYSTVKKDYDDGVEVYEVEFRVGRYEYNYDIEISTGRILDFEIDD